MKSKIQELKDQVLDIVYQRDKINEEISLIKETSASIIAQIKHIKEKEKLGEEVDEGWYIRAKHKLAYNRCDTRKLNSQLALLASDKKNLNIEITKIQDNSMFKNILRKLKSEMDDEKYKSFILECRTLDFEP